MDRTTARVLIDSLNRDAERIAAHFGLRYRSITAERANVKSHYGVCDSDGSIRIRLRHASTGQPLRYSSLVSTLCHELAHLRHFDHGECFRAFYREVLEWARAQGIYRPRGPALAAAFRPAGAPSAARPPAVPPRAQDSRRPAQLSLF